MTRHEIEHRIDFLDRRFKHLEAARVKATAEGNYAKTQRIDEEQEELIEVVEKLRVKLYGGEEI